MFGGGVKAQVLARAAESLHPPVTFDHQDMRVTLEFDAQQWVLVPRIIMGSPDRIKHGWAKDVAVSTGERYGYGKRAEWTLTLAEMMSLYTGYSYLLQAAVLLRIGHEPAVAPRVRATTFNAFENDLADPRELAGELANPDKPKRKPALVEYAPMHDVEAACVTRFFSHDDGDPYASIALGYGFAGARLAAFETVVGGDDTAEIDAARRDTIDIAGTTRVVVTGPPAAGR